MPVLDFKIGPRDRSRITATPPYTVEWQGLDAVIQHTGRRLTITTKGELFVKVFTPGYRRTGRSTSDPVGGTSYCTNGFELETPMEADETPDTTIPTDAEVKAHLGAMKAEAKREQAAPEDLLPEPVEKIRESLMTTGVYDFWMDDKGAKLLIDKNSFGRALAPLAVALGRESDGRWRLTLA